MIFGGRRQGGRCTNDVWSLDLAGAWAGDSFDLQVAGGRMNWCQESIR